MLPASVLARAPDVLQALRGRGWMLATAESCTGGLIAAALTHVAGSSDVVACGFVTYANAAKTALLGVPEATIQREGAVSAAVAAAMAEGALVRLEAEGALVRLEAEGAPTREGVAVSVTGIAGPGGGTPGKPVGLVWFGCASAGVPTWTVHGVFAGDRAAVRAQAVGVAFDLLLARAAGDPMPVLFRR